MAPYMDMGFQVLQGVAWMEHLCESSSETAVAFFCSTISKNAGHQVDAGELSNSDA